MEIVSEFDKEIYLAEMKTMLATAIARLRQEKPDFVIYTASIWTDPDAAVSAINFDSKRNSLRHIKQGNKWDKKYYDQYMAEGDIERAELFKPVPSVRHTNPADFELRNFAKSAHRSFPKNWAENTHDKCWTLLRPVLTEFGKYAFEQMITQLNIDSAYFELGINSKRDWYDKTWSVIKKPKKPAKKDTK